MQAVGETALPEELVSLRNELVPVAEGCNPDSIGKGNTRSSVKGKDVKDRRSSQAVACMKRCTQELGRPIQFLGSNMG